MPPPSPRSDKVYIGPGNQVRTGNNNIPLAPAVSWLGPYLQVRVRVCVYACVYACACACACVCGTQLRACACQCACLRMSVYVA